jgi:transcription elongation factor Elf1
MTRLLDSLVNFNCLRLIAERKCIMLRSKNKMYTCIYTGKQRIVSCPISIRSDSKRSAMYLVCKMLGLDTDTEIKVISIDALARMVRV